MTEPTRVPLETTARGQLRDRLAAIYQGRDELDLDRLAEELALLITARREVLPDLPARRWDASDVVLIGYADQLRSPDAPPLETLAEFCRREKWSELISAVHLLPFCPSSSDDGFSVVDYRAVDPAVGDWDHIAQLGSNFHLMFDLVLNHCSAQSAWFDGYRRGKAPYDQFFIEVDGDPDLSEVVRPRSLPLLTEFETSRGRRRVWTTFSADQVDLNYANPAVLMAMLDVLLEYVARGAQIIRLDAVAFLWKEFGTSCVHLRQTHAVVKLMRDVLRLAAPHVWLITETNVPHRENVSYFGAGDEAHLVYQFPLPPLLLDAFTQGDAQYLNRWIAQLESPPPGTTYFNFTASHDGVGVRPLEGLVPAERLDALVRAVLARGGMVSTRRQGDVDLPYELNITYLDALRPEGPQEDFALHARRFLATQAVMLGLQGVPAPYFLSLVGAQNDRAAADATGQPRRINRRKFVAEELRTTLQTEGTLSHAVYHGYRRMLRRRRQQPAFHPDAAQRVPEHDDQRLVALVRHAATDEQTVLVAANVSNEPLKIEPHRLAGTTIKQELLSGQELETDKEYSLLPGQAGWFST